MDGRAAAGRAAGGGARDARRALLRREGVGQYPRVEELIPPTAELRVSRNGRRLAAAEVTLWCGSGRSLESPAVTLSLRRNPDAVVRRDGSFGFHAVGLSATEGRVRL